MIERLEALELLGAAPEGTTISEMLFGANTDPGGLFDPRAHAVYIRRGTVKGEIDVLSHELTHALELEHGARRATPAGDSPFDSLEAQRALIEGSATLVQYLYAARYQLWDD